MRHRRLDNPIHNNTTNNSTFLPVAAQQRERLLEKVSTHVTCSVCELVVRSASDEPPPTWLVCLLGGRWTAINLLGVPSAGLRVTGCRVSGRCPWPCHVVLCVLSRARLSRARSSRARSSRARSSRVGHHPAPAASRRRPCRTGPGPLCRCAACDQARAPTRRAPMLTRDFEPLEVPLVAQRRVLLKRERETGSN